MAIFGSKKKQGFDTGLYLELSPVASAFLGDNGEIIQSNAAFTALVSLNLKLHDNIDKIVGSTPGNDFERAISRLKKSALNATNFDIKIKSANEKPAHVLLKKLDEKDFDGEIRYLVTLLDTQEKASLEQKLNHSQKMQAVGQLAGGIAHDFNNLLTAMNGFCDLLLQRHPPGDRSFPDIMQIKQNANRAANLVRQLLAFSRKQVLKAKLLDLTDVLSDLSNLLRRLLGEKVVLDMKHGRDLWKILADQGQIDQVTINLAVNARDAMPKGGKLLIETQNVTIAPGDKDLQEFFAPDPEDPMPNGEYVMLKVADTGTGMTREILTKIFEPFFSTKEVGAGTGLGLATVYGIVKQTGGYIMVKSAEGQGTEFRIFLKRADEAAYVEEKEEKKAAGQDLTGTETILIVEDEVPVRIFASRALSNKGYKIVEADNAEVALELLQQHGEKIDLVLTDVIMPGMNGPTMVNEIRKNYPNVKVIFMSGYTEDALEDYEGDVSEINFLQKPFTLKDLAAKVKDVVGK
jgi:two-component system cell cycle sensor histidine kinase/response regulator CckA